MGLGASINPTKLRLVYFGMTGQLSVMPLQKILTATLPDVEISAVIVPTSGQQAKKEFPRLVKPPAADPLALPVMNVYMEHHIVHIAWENQIPVWEVDSLSTEPTQALLREKLHPDLILVVCFPHLLPSDLLQLPRYGCLNLHPSPLPAYRGPTPLFWMARQGEPQGGVTLHFLDEGIDTGDIVAQTIFDWPEGLPEPEVEKICSRLGGELIVEAIKILLQKGTLPQRPQLSEDNRYFSYPSTQDFIIPTNWSVRQAFHFGRGAISWPLRIKIDQQRQFPIRAVLKYRLNKPLDQAYTIIKRDELWVQFEDGVLKVKI